MGLLLKPPDLPKIVSTAGMDAGAVRALVSSGGWRRVRRGALTTTTPGLSRWRSREHDALALVAAVHRKLSDDAVISHSSAALLHGLWLHQLPEVVHVTRESTWNGRGAPDIRRHCRQLEPDEVTIVGDVRLTTIERTIVDCARTMHPRDALVVADAGMRALIKPDRSRRNRDTERIGRLRERLLQMVGAGAGHGRRRARTVIRAATPYAESPRESVLRWIVLSHGLPTPTAQTMVRTRDGTFYTDLGWQWSRRLPDGSWQVVWRVLAEYDGDVKYLPDGGLVHSLSEASAALVAEKRREDLIREDRDTRYLRFSREDLRDPGAVVARLLAAMPPAVGAEVSPIPELLVGPRTPLR